MPSPSPVERDPFSLQSLKSSIPWLVHFRENLVLLFTLQPGQGSSANGAPIHLLDMRHSRPSGRAQTVSLLLHIAAGIAVLLVLTNVRPPQKLKGIPRIVDGPFPRLTYAPSSPKAGMLGGNTGNNPLPPTRGALVFSQIQLLRPRLPDQQTHPLTAQPSIQDDQAPDITPADSRLGLPWMNEFTNSGGPGPGDSIGRGKNGQMGDEDGPNSGRGNDHGPYRPGVTPVMCAYCPDPLYTDEARKAKLQGTVTLRVLVGKDGRASDIRIVGGLGLGLDERAIETIRAWRFVPAKDAAHNPVPSWITIETVYRLF